MPRCIINSRVVAACPVSQSAALHTHTYTHSHYRAGPSQHPHVPLFHIYPSYSFMPVLTTLTHLMSPLFHARSHHTILILTIAQHPFAPSLHCLFSLRLFRHTTYRPILTHATTAYSYKHYCPPLAQSNPPYCVPTPRIVPLLSKLLPKHLQRPSLTYSCSLYSSSVPQ